MELLEAAELGRRLSMPAAIDALEAFRTQDPEAARCARTWRRRQVLSC